MTEKPSDFSVENEPENAADQAPENSAQPSEDGWFSTHDAETFEESASDENAPIPEVHLLQHPVVLSLMLVAALFIVWKSLPDVTYVFTHQEPTDCGKISDRPFVEDLKPLEHNSYCTMESVVQSLMIMSSGGSDKAAADDPTGRKYFVKLDGDKIFAILAADREDVQRWLHEQNSLLGFSVTGPGRIIDPDEREELAGTAQKLRYTFSIDNETPIRLYDTTDHPWNHWPKLLIAALAALIALASACFLVRNLRKS